ncbi:ACP phosphodiesterase [Neiella marina]|uniref:ACP phosphodiesterase n=1 Tax=Neiella holothuriorum TaxID=2870530 RepID=A0ABS7EK38_9GAMM|nr:ACP phosphodiesterase [Neiella holothuriorum]MBW8192722.1 ACP phosphodiesterase [Neiella holothuriorum]
MNFLAHFHLASLTQTSLTGALIGDFVRGQQHMALDETVRFGVMMHRKVDVFSDKMASVQQLRQHFEQGQRRYIGIVTDMLFDHLLSKHWHQFYPQPLPQYAQSVYQQLQSFAGTFSNYERVRVAMSEGNWLARYGTEQEIVHALSRISLRLKKSAPLATIGQQCLTHHYSLLEQALFEDYPQLQQQLQDWLSTAQ